MKGVSQSPLAQRMKHYPVLENRFSFFRQTHPCLRVNQLRLPLRRQVLDCGIQALDLCHEPMNLRDSGHLRTSHVEKTNPVETTILGPAPWPVLNFSLSFTHAFVESTKEYAFPHVRPSCPHSLCLIRLFKSLHHTVYSIPRHPWML